MPSHVTIRPAESDADLEAFSRIRRLVVPNESAPTVERIVGYAGLIAWNGDETLAENGLTVVDRAWRGRGLGAALKRRQLAWAAANGIREIVTWTQQGNEAMQHLNAGLGYSTRSISRTMQRDLP
jgi:mycothiol synthase